MDNYICTECRRTFDTPHEYEERHGFTHGLFEKWSVCPYCGEPGYEEATICDICGDAIPINECHTVQKAADDIYTVCSKCYREEDE